MASHKLIEHVDTAIVAKGSIVEIGSARENAGPESSTAYFAELAGRLNVEFFSVDFSPQSHDVARSVVGDRAYLSDGVEFLMMYPSLTGRPISVLYLDNFDVVYNDKHHASLMQRVGTVYQDRGERLTNERSAAVHLEQLEASLKLLSAQHAVIVDDTKRIADGWWGKGALVVPFLVDRGYALVAESEDGVLLTSPP